MMHRKRFHDFGWTKTWIIYLNYRLDLLGREHWFYTIMFDLQSYLNMMMSRHSPSLLTPTVFSGTEMVMGFLGLQLSSHNFFRLGSALVEGEMAEPSLIKLWEVLSRMDLKLGTYFFVFWAIVLSPTINQVNLKRCLPDLITHNETSNILFCVICFGPKMVRSG